ncbi:hypothetical protein BV20DRAFT_286768 [Pilatotrama ljubarskyi]|nr:hypothetical protein BV20DRAFT_286768 [Pilatotrama ljubarskyi]
MQPSHPPGTSGGEPPPVYYGYQVSAQSESQVSGRRNDPRHNQPFVNNPLTSQGDPQALQTTGVQVPQPQAPLPGQWPPPHHGVHGGPAQPQSFGRGVMPPQGSMHSAPYTGNWDNVPLASAVPYTTYPPNMQSAMPPVRGAPGQANLDRDTVRAAQWQHHDPRVPQPWSAPGSNTSSQGYPTGPRSSQPPYAAPNQFVTEGTAPAPPYGNETSVHDPYRAGMPREQAVGHHTHAGPTMHSGVERAAVITTFPRSNASDSDG